MRATSTKPRWRIGPAVGGGSGCARDREEEEQWREVGEAARGLYIDPCRGRWGGAAAAPRQPVSARQTSHGGRPATPLLSARHRGLVTLEKLGQPNGLFLEIKIWWD